LTPPAPPASRSAPHSDSVGGVVEAATALAHEEALLARLRGGDGAAYEELVRTHTGRLLATTRRLLRNEEDARDAVQDAFLSAFKALPSFGSGCRLGTWLFRIATNAALMKLRSRKRRKERAIEDLLPRFSEDGHYLEPPAPWEDRADVAAERAETRAFVRDAIDQMPEIYRTVLLLRDIAGLKTEEVAETLECTPNAVKIRLHRAHQALRTLLDTRFRETTT